MKKSEKLKNILKKSVSYIIVAALSSALTLVACNASQRQQWSKLYQLKGIIDTCFIGDVDEKAVEDLMAAGMVQALGDQWSYYVPADQYQSLMDAHNNSYVGIGVTIDQLEEDGGFLIKRLEPNGSAIEAGILSGDVIIGVDGKKVSEVGSETALNMISGEEGTEVTLLVLRDDKELSFTMKRKKIETIVATGQMLTETVGYIRIHNFSERCAQETKAIFDDLEGRGAKAMILDVRFNPGGYVKEMVEVLDYLLPEGEVFRSVDYSGNTEIEYSDSSCKTMPMAVLINNDSVSAAEFFAAALVEKEYAVTVGQPTLGKGYFQSTLPLEDGSAVNLSMGKYYTPNGVNLADAGGLKPDVPVEVDLETQAKIYSQELPLEEDTQIQKALELMEGKTS